jgi:isoleucyl-tRNA synthetase
MQVVLAKNLVSYQFAKGFTQVQDVAELASYEKGAKQIPYLILDTCLGKELLDLRYAQLLPYAQPAENAAAAFRVIGGDFVTTEDGTGIVHTAPTFGADDARVAADAGVPGLLVADERGNLVRQK